jgi:Succinate dehydrogenase/fumarate reductase, flavoprotein subunit
MTISIADNKVMSEEKRIFDGIFRGRGQVNPYEIRKEFSDLMDVKAYIFRNENQLIEGLKKLENSGNYRGNM